MFRDLLAQGITCVGTLQMNKKGIPPFLKDVQGRLDDYTILYEVGGKLSLHSWVTKSKRKGELWLIFLVKVIQHLQSNCWCCNCYYTFLCLGSEAAYVTVLGIRKTFFWFVSCFSDQFRFCSGSESKCVQTRIWDKINTEKYDKLKKFSFTIGAVLLECVLLLARLTFGAHLTGPCGRFF